MMSRQSTHRRGRLKTVIFYVAPYVLFIAVAELILYLVFILQEQQTCIDKWTTYGYCAGYSEVRDLSREKQSYTKVYVYVDEFGGRQPGPVPSVFPANSRVFIIGDSFVQADELPYEMTMGGVLNANSVPTYALGYSSWNPIQYSGAIAKLGGLKGDYHVFMYINDFTPTYERSVAGELAEAKIKKSWWQRLTAISRLAALVDSKWERIWAAHDGFGSNPAAVNAHKALTGNGELSFTREAFRECGPIAAIWGEAGISDTMMFAKHYSCWPDEFRRQVDLEVDATQRLVENFSANAEGTLHLYLIPSGWAFPYQNTAGRAHPTLGIPDAAGITQAGLADYLQFKGLNVTDLEPFLQQQLDAMAPDCGHCENTLYLENDGHWTALANKLVALNYLD